MGNVRIRREDEAGADPAILLRLKRPGEPISLTDHEMDALNQY